MSENLFSIITVTLNPGNGLEPTLRSVAEQTCQAFEHIVKDGGSTDGKIEAVAKNPRINCIIQPDSGIYDAMNQAIIAATGRYILFLNAGDRLFDEQVLAKVAARLKEHPSELIYGYIEDHGTIVNYPEKLTDWYMYRNSICHQAWFLSRRCYALCGGFDLDYKILADQNLLLDMIVNRKVSYQLIKEPMVSVAPMGFSAANSLLKYAERTTISKALFSNLQGKLMRLIHGLTLPRLRIGLSIHPRTRRYYKRFSNFFNK